MITEDYVSFETAKLLKEKGFDVPCDSYYDYFSSNVTMYQGYVPEFSDSCTNHNGRDNFDVYSRPTLQMAMMWLREVHNLSVEVYRTACGYIGCIVAIPSGTDIKFLEEDGDDLPSGQYTKWEYACEASIKYCLEKLI